MRACRRAGLACARGAVDDDGALLGTTGLVMRRVPGETIARRILRDDEYAAARACAGRRAGRVPRRAARHRSRRGARRRGARPAGDLGQVPAARAAQPDLRAAYDWLQAHRPPHAADALDPRRPAHGQHHRGARRPRGGDRLGAHPPRRSARGPRVAVPQGVALRRAARGGRSRHDRRARRRVRSGRWSPDRPRHARTGGWSRRRSRGVSAACSRATSTSPGGVRSVDLAAVGRRAAEQEWDLIELLAPDACAAARAAPMPGAAARRRPLRPADRARAARRGARVPHRAGRDQRRPRRSPTTAGSPPTSSESSSASWPDPPPIPPSPTRVRAPAGRNWPSPSTTGWPWRIPDTSPPRPRAPEQPPDPPDVAAP